MAQQGQVDDGASIPRGERTFAHNVWLTVGIVTAVLITLFLLWTALKEVLAIFAGILLAVFLHGISSWLEKRTFLPRKAALFLTVLTLLLLIVIGSFLIFPSLAEQSSRLGEQLQTSLTTVEATISSSTVGQWILEQTANLQSLAAGDGATIISRASTLFSTTMDALVRVLIVLFVGFYLAYEPQVYINGLLKLFPPSRRNRYREALDKTAYSLRWWLAGRLASMVIVGVLSTIGLMLLGIPLAFILGLLAGLLAFIPLLGPTLALVPPMLIAFTESPQKALYVFILYMGIQFVESYFLTPVIQRRAAALPPVLLIGSQVLMGLFAGLLGVMLAAPLAVTGMVMVKMLYVEDVLHDHSVEYLEDVHRQQESAASQEKAQMPGATRVSHEQS